MASKGGTRTSSSSLSAAISVHAPPRRAKASSVCSAGSTSQRCGDARLRHRGGACRSGRCGGCRGSAPRRPSPARGRTTAPAGRTGMRSRRQPARSGTSTSEPRCSSGSSRIHQPPGPPRPLSKGVDEFVAQRRTGHGMARGRPRMEVQRALDELGDHVRRGRRGRPGRWPGGGPWARAGSWRDSSASPGACQADFSPRCSGSRSTSWAISLVQAETQGMRERSTR